MAHGIFREKVKQVGLHMEIESAGTSGFHNGEPADSRAIATLQSKGIDILDLRSRLFIPTDFEDYDYIITMDSSNQKNVLEMANEADSNNFPKMVMDFQFPGEHISVPDPYYGGATGFEDVYKMLDESLDELLEQIRD